MASFAEWTEQEKKKKKKKKPSAEGVSFTEYTKQVLGRDDIEAPLSERKKEEDIAPVKNSGGGGDFGGSGSSRSFGEGEKGDFWDWLGDSAMSGLAKFNKIYTTTVDVILGKPLQELGWENNPISSVAEHYAKDYDYYKGKAQEETAKMGGGGWKVAEEIVSGTVAAAPDAAFALMTMGGSTAASATSLATQATYRTGNLLTKAGMTTSAMAKNPQFWLSFTRTYGDDYEEAINSGADETTAAFTSTLTSLINAGIEIGVDGGSGFQGLPDKVKSGDKSAIRAWVESSLEEGGEEVLQGFVNDIVAKVSYDPNREMLNPKEMATEFGMGAAVGGILGGGQIAVQSGINAGVNAVQKAEASKLTETEQKIVDKVYEDRVAEAEENGKLTQKEKSKIYDTVLNDMEKGYISTDTIESVLGGETYKTYKDTIDSEDALQSEFDTLNKMKQGEMTGEQIDRRAELKQKLEELKNNSQRDQLKQQLSDEVFGVVKDSRLVESYNERARRGTAFEADLSKYDTKQQAVVQKAVESGILNNTNRTHEFVDMVAKISADKGVLFDFTNNAKLKESGFAIDGKSVNGYVTKDGITVNMDSNKYVNSVVGHEITHILEGTELYTELQSAVMAYAKSKNDYQGRYDALTELYKDIEGADIDAELTADLVGDYLFTDSDFINRLSTENRNVFQKIYDEIKYLCRVATAGSKEARELEKVKRAFDKAYKGSGKAQGSTKYSLAMVEEVQPKSDKWHRTLTTEEAKARFPKLWDVAAEESEVRNPTQISSTVKSYRKVYDYLKSEGFNGTILDASSGLGYGTKAGIEEYGFNVEDIEPYPDKNYEPKYKDYSALDKKYDVVISNAVLNVLPQDQRDALVVKMGEMLNDGGRIFINVRGKDVDTLASNKNNTNISPMEWFVDSTGSYQKGFTKPELVSYLQDALGDGFTVKPTSMFGAVSAIVTKDGGVQYSLSDSDGNTLSNDQAEYFKDSKVRDGSGKLLPVYHGSKNGGFNVFQYSKDNQTGTDYEARPIDTYIAFKKEQITSVDNKKPTTDHDIRYSLTEYTDAEKKAHNEAVKNHFGKTYSWNETGYLLLDGTKLDLSGKHEGASGGYRTVDHRDIVDALGDDYGNGDYSGALVQFMSEGNIRIIPEMGGINLSVKPTEAQEKALAEYVMKHRGEVVLDIDDTNGYTVVSVEYPIGTRASKVLSDIRGWFENGTKPEIPIRYSLSEGGNADNDVMELDGGAVTKYSLSTWTPETKSRVKDDLVKAGYEEERVDKWIKDTNSVAAVIAADKDRLDFVAADNQTMLKNNQEYVKTLDASTLCAKLLVYQGTFDAIQHRLPNTMLSSDDLISLLNMMKKHGVETPCSVCYVESRRRHLGKFAQEWLNQYKGEYKPRLDEVTTSDGLESLRKSHPNTYQDFVDAMNKKGSANPKVVQLRTEYRNEIMSLTPAQIRKIESIGGLRVQSFSDFETPHLLDMMQAVMDMSAKGLTSQAYTKVPNFAWVFGDTGIKINLSLIADGDGFDSNGNLAFSPVEGMDFDEAMKLRDAYSKNVGTIIVGANDKHILACMADDRIDFIIPFHRSGWGQKELDMMGMSSYEDYTYGQNEHDLVTGKNLENLYPPDYWDYNLGGKENAERYLNLCAKTGREPKFSKFLVNNGDGSYSLQPDGSTDGYWKTLIDFKMYDNDGNGAKQQKVQPNFNMSEAHRVLAEYEGGANSLPVANDVVEEFVARYKSRTLHFNAEELAPAMSLSYEGEHHPYGRGDGAMSEIAYGNYHVKGKDLLLEQEIAPVEVEQETTTDNKATSDNVVPDGFAPITEEEAEVLRKDSFASIDDADMPPEVEPSYSGEKLRIGNPLDLFANRDIDEVGNRKVKAYMYENPEVKPFFQEAAYGMLYDLQHTVKGERWYDDKLYYESGGELGFSGVKRHTTDDIAYLLDNYHYTYDQIEAGLNAIIEDNGAENNAVSKRIEFMLNDRLKDGYTGVFGEPIPRDENYVKLLEEKQINEYSKEAFESLLANADDYAPYVEEEVAPHPADEVAVEDIAPVAEVPGTEAVTPDIEQTAKVAEVMDAEPETQKRKRSVLAKFKTDFLDKGAVFEDLSLKTKNRELIGKWNHTLSAESRAQWLIGKGTRGVKSLNSIREEVERTGKTKQFFEYVYHKHNIDRMSLESEENRTKREKLRKQFKGYSDNQIRDIALEWITKETPEDAKARIKAAREYVDTLKGKNKPVFGDAVTADVSREVVERYEAENPEFKAFANDVYGYMNHLRDLMVENGVISKETAELWSNMYPYFVPIRRLGDEGLNINVPLDTMKTGVNAPIKGATGGNRDILPLFDTMAMRTEQTYKAIARNSFGLELKNTLKSTIASEETSVDDIFDSIDTNEELLQEGKDGKNPTFTVFDNGKRVTFEITEDMYDALKPTSDRLAYTNKVANTASNVFRGLLTEYNPVFMLTNAAKDIQDVLLNSQHATKTYATIPQALSQIVSKGKWYTEYMENGGEQNTYFDKQTNTFEVENNLFKKTIGLPLRAISEANNFIEKLPRLAEYIASRKSGASVEVAMLDAGRVNTNFAAGGDVTKFLNRNGFTFLNASTQGFMQQVRNVREAKANGLKGWVQLATKFALAGLPAILLNNLLWDDDEEYEELSGYVKQNYYVVAKFGDGKFVRIPKGRAVAVIQNAFEQMNNLRTGDDEIDLNSFLELAISNLAPNNPLENNIIAPIMQVANNETWYGEALVPTRLQDLPQAEQYDESTDSISRWLGEKLNFSPYKINYLLNQYSGGVGDVVLPMLTPEAESGDNSPYGNVIAPLKDKFTTDSVMNNQNVSDFYDKVDELTANAKSRKATDEDILKSKYINSVNSDLGELYAEKREIQNSSLADDAKYAQVRSIQQQIDELAKESLNTYNNVTINGKYATVGDTHYRWYEPSETSDAEAGWQKITDKQLEKQEEVTSGLGISASEYWSNKEEYDYAYEYPENYAVAKSVGGYEAYKTYSSELYDIKADKDENGKSITGSRKEKVIEYVNNLDVDDSVKFILFKNEYNADDTYNYEIIDYLNEREDISYVEMETILKKLGFTVSADGTISW